VNSPETSRAIYGEFIKKSEHTYMKRIDTQVYQTTQRIRLKIQFHPESGEIV